MSFFKLDIDLLPINITVYKKKNDNFILLSLNKEAQKTKFFNQHNLLGRDVTDIYLDAK